MPTGSRQKIAYLETMRGVACLLLVFYHAIGSVPEAGLQFPAGHPLHDWSNVLVTARMPLFSFVSGFVFVALARSFGEWRGRLGSKIRRLLVPLYVVGTLHFLMQSFVATPTLPYVQTLYLGYDHFWFLQATFLLMFAHLTLSWALGGNGVRAAQILFVVAVVGYLTLDPEGLPIYSLDHAFFLGPYFFGGHLVAHYLTRWNEKPETPRRSLLLVVVTVIMVLAYLLETAMVLGFLSIEPVPRVAFVLFTGIVTCAFFFIGRFTSPFLQRIGDKSYAIYLFHVFFTAGTREVLWRFFPSLPPEALLVPVVFAGLVGPVIAQWLILKHPVSAYLFLGVRLKPKPAAAAEAPQPVP
jgi:peptidoglycan/LPS O-acetylase OafA/YrhL